MKMLLVYFYIYMLLYAHSKYNAAKKNLENAKRNPN